MWPQAAMAPSAGSAEFSAQPAAAQGHLSSLRRFIWGGERWEAVMAERRFDL